LRSTSIGFRDRQGSESGGILSSMTKPPLEFAIEVKAENVKGILEELQGIMRECQTLNQRLPLDDHESRASLVRIGEHVHRVIGGLTPSLRVSRTAVRAV
jgi:hypothetical protein